MIQIPDDLFAKDGAGEAAPAPDFDTELEAARRTAALTQASAAATQALHALDRSFDDDAASDPASWPVRFESEVQRIKRDDLADHLGSEDGGAFLQDFDDLASAKLAAIRRLGAARELEGGRKGLQSALDNYVGLAADASSDIEAGIVRDQAKATIARMDQAGFLRAGEADGLERGFFDREESARLTRLIDTDPDGAVEALSDPSRFGSLAPDARLRLRDRAELRAEDAVRESAQAAESTRQGQLAGLMLRLDAGEADRADVMEAAASGWLSDAERERALARWQSQRLEIRQRESDLNRVKSLFTGEGNPLDTRSEDDRRALDTHFDDTKAAWQAAGLTDDQLNPLIADYLAVTGAVPKGLNRDIAGAFRGGTWEERIRVAELLDDLHKRIRDWLRDSWKPSPWESSGYDPEDFRPHWPFRPGPVPMPDVGSELRPMPRWPGRGSIWGEFDPRDIAEALLINALIGGGWPRAKAPDRAAMLFDRSFEQNDRFASSDTAGYEKYLDGLSAQGQIEPQLRAQLASYVAAPRTGTPARPESSGAGGPSYTDGIDFGGPRYAEGIDTQTEPAPESSQPQLVDSGSGQAKVEIGSGSAAIAPPALPPAAEKSAESNQADATVAPTDEAPAPEAEKPQSLWEKILQRLGITPPPGTAEDAKGQAGNLQRFADKDNDESRAEVARIWAEIAAGRISVSSLRDENGNIRIGAYTIGAETADILERIEGLDPADEAGSRAITRAIGRGEPRENGLTAGQRAVLVDMLRDKVKTGGFKAGNPAFTAFDIVRLDEDGAAIEQRATDGLAARMARQSGRTVRNATPPIAAALPSRTGRPEAPHGFKSKGDFDEFSGKLYSGLEAAGHTDSKVFIRGSAASGTSFKTGKPFDSGRRSDFDLAIVSPDLFEKAKNLGIGVRQGASRTGPLNAKNLEDLGLTELVRGLAKQHGRKVSFMIYNSEASMLSRGEAIELGRQRQEKGQ